MQNLYPFKFGVVVIVLQRMKFVISFIQSFMEIFFVYKTSIQVHIFYTAVSQSGFSSYINTRVYKTIELLSKIIQI